MTRSAEAIQQHLPEIIDRWAVEAQKAASARDLSAPELRNLMPRLFEVLTTREHKPEELRRYLESHLGSRIRQGFDLAEMVDEFAIVERVANSVWDALPPEEQPSRQQRAQISLSLQQSIVAVTEMFQEHMRLDEQHEKRYLRELQSVAYNALRTPATAEQTQLKDMLELVMEAMGAQCAAMFVYEPNTQHLIMKACVGEAEEPLQEFLVALEPPISFVGTIASQEIPTSIRDVETTELTVSESLRHSGIHALLGIRLPPRLRLIGVMYVGLRDKRAFTPREVRRLETLGDRMTLHLDNARLYTELREHVEELGIERSLRETVVAMLAHDLRGPLTTVQLVAQQLGERNDGRDEQELIVRMKRNLDRVDRMIRDLLDLSRVRAGQPLPLHLVDCDLCVLAEEVVSELRATHGDRFELVMDRAVRGIWSHDELRRALWNLSVNAVKYGAQDITVTVRVQQLPDGARLSVHNAGDPISPEDQTMLFDAYSRVSAAPGLGSAWGLGLALVRACAEAHGGKAQVRSTPEDGTTLIIELPRDSRPFQREPPSAAT